MALDSLGYRYGHTTVWEMVALYKQAHPDRRRCDARPRPGRRSYPPTAPHQVWCVDVRYLIKIEGHWLYSILLFDGYSRAIVGAGCLDRQNLSRVVQVCRQAIAQWGVPEAIVRDNAGVFLALSPCLQQLGIRWVRLHGGIDGRTWPKGASPASAACWMPMWRDAPIGRRSIASMRSLCRTISSGAIGCTNVWTPRDACTTVARGHLGECPGERG